MSFRRRIKHHSVTVNFYEQLCGSGSIIIIIITISNIIVIMDSYYASQVASSSVGTFHGPARQFGSGAGLEAFALRVGRTAMPLLKYVGPFEKQVGHNVLEAALPEVVSLIKGKKGKQSLNKRALEDSAKKVLAKVVETHAAARRRCGGRAGNWRQAVRPEKKSSAYSQIIVLLSDFKQKVCKKKSAGYFGKREIHQQLLRVTK